MFIARVGGVSPPLNGETGADLPVDLWEITPEPNLPPVRHRPSRERSTPDWSPDMCGSVVHVSVSVCAREEDRIRKRKERSRAVRGPFDRVLLRHSPGIDRRNHGKLPIRAAGR